MSDSDSMDTRLALYQDAVDNIRLAKQQQWNVAYYNVALAGGIIWVAEAAGSSESLTEFEQYTFAFSGVLLSLGASFFQCEYQAWMLKYRKRLRTLLDGLPAKPRQIWEELGPVKDKPFGYDASFVAAFAIASAITAGVMAWYFLRSIGPSAFVSELSLMVAALYFLISEQQAIARYPRPKDVEVGNPLPID